MSVATCAKPTLTGLTYSYDLADASNPPLSISLPSGIDTSNCAYTGSFTSNGAHSLPYGPFTTSNAGGTLVVSPSSDFTLDGTTHYFTHTLFINGYSS